MLAAWSAAHCGIPYQTMVCVDACVGLLVWMVLDTCLIDLPLA
jgi:hypothetical protein